MPTRRIVTLAVLVALGALPLGTAPSLANGGKSKRVLYRGVLQAGNAAGQEIQFDAEVEPLLLRLTGVGDRYRVIRIRIRNFGAQPLVLSAGADTLEAQVRNGPIVKAVLDLGARDAALWDGLEADLRSAVVYPRVVAGGEEESVFAFLPAAELADAPEGFRYAIASRPDRPVLIRDVSTAVAR
jgi:hypothetical protein